MARLTPSARNARTTLETRGFNVQSCTAGEDARFIVKLGSVYCMSGYCHELVLFARGVEYGHVLRGSRKEGV